VSLALGQPDGQLELIAGADKDTEQARKARGAFFTPPQLSSYISRWAVRTVTDRILEPSCGEAAFLLAAATRLDDLGAAGDPAQLSGVELHADSAAAARRAIAATGRPAEVRTSSRCRERGHSTQSSATRPTSVTRASPVTIGPRAGRRRCAGEWA